MNRIELLKALIAKETDEAELERLGKELDAAIREDEKLKLAAAEKERVEKEAAAKAEKERLEKAGKDAEGKPRRSGIEVGIPDVYKGRRFQLEIEAFGDHLRNKGLSMDEKKIERQAKGWIDLIAASMGGVAVKAKGMPAGTMSPDRVQAILKAGIDEGVDSNEGSVFVAPEYMPDVLAYAREESRALRICRNVPMNSNIMYVPRELAKVSVAATAEQTAATETTPTFNAVTLTAKRWDAFADISNEFLEDAYMPILPILIDQFMEAIGAKNDSAVFDATGDPMSSVFSAAAGYSVVLGSGSETFSEFVFTNFTAAVGKLATARARGARWAIHRSPLWTYVNSIVDSQGRPMFVNPTAQTPGAILGWPVEQLENGPSATAVSTAIAVFGNFMGVMIGHRKDSIDLMMDPYSAAKSYQTRFYLFTRWAHALALANNFVRLVTASG
jgi:HK97 family phage major capsid protein